MLSFVIRGAITTFLPWGKVALTFGEAVAVAAEKALDFGLEGASELKGHSVGSTRHVPVQIGLMKGFTPYDVAVPDMRKIETLFKAYAPMPDVMTISRVGGNVIDAEPGNVGPGGGLGIHLVLASLSGIDPKAVIRRYAERMNHPTSPKYTVGHAAYDLHNELRPLVRAGVDAVMRDHVNPLPIVTSAA